MNGVYSYQTPDPTLFSYFWEADGRFLSDLPELSDDVYLSPRAVMDSRLVFRVIAQTHGDYSELLGTGARVGWFLTWYSDGMLGGTFLRGLLSSSVCGLGPGVVELAGSVDARDAGNSITVNMSLVVIEPGSISNASVACEPGLVLERQSKTLVLSGATPELEVELVDFQESEGLPSGIPYHIDLKDMPADPNDALETGAIRILINAGHPFAASLEGNGDASILSKSTLTQAFYSAILENLASSRLLDGDWPVGPPARGSVGMLWSTILQRVIFEGNIADLRALMRDSEEYRKAILIATWTGGHQ